MAMKKYTVLMSIPDENGELQYTKKAFFAEESKEIKVLPGFEKIQNTERVTHPSPEVMQRALLASAIDLAKFYGDCDTIAVALEKKAIEDAKNLSDEDKVKVKEREAARERRKAEAEANMTNEEKRAREAVRKAKEAAEKAREIAKKSREKNVK